MELFGEERPTMADTNMVNLEEMLTCPVCRDIFKDPRQLPCGHSLCMSCLESMLDLASNVPFRCPDCRGYFGAVLRIQKSYALSSIAEEFRGNMKRKERKSVYCDFCSEKTTLAKKTCLKCEVSMCDEHAKNHHELPVYIGHPLVSPLCDFLERKCPQHEDKVLKYYCNTSRRYICNMCAFERKQLNQTTEACTVLRRQLTLYMDQNFKIIEEQMKEANELVKTLKKPKVNPAGWPFNIVTGMLLFLWFIVLYYASDYAVENQSLVKALETQQNRVAKLLVDHPMKSHHAETENQELDASMTPRRSSPPAASPPVLTRGRWRLRDTGTSPCPTRASNARTAAPSETTQSPGAFRMTGKESCSHITTKKRRFSLLPCRAAA
nr:E3 ubiquitin-protein ligase Midline-1-like isoform X3 [Labrus bergylta]